MRTIGERAGGDIEFYNRFGDKLQTDIRVAIPGIIQSFDPVEQTVTVQPTIKENIVDQSGNVKKVALPLLLDVPIVLPRAGGYVLTMPIKKGDECLVIFADSCIDAWWSYGGIQTQAEKRRHDLSDGFAILGTWSQPRTVSNYSTDSMQLRNEAGTQYIDISDSGINLVGNIKKNGVPL